MRAEVVHELREILGRAGLISEPGRLLTYECDGLALLHERPELVLLPRTTDECARALRVLHREKIAVVGRGAGTGLSGGATPVKGGVVLGTARMRDVLEINAVDRYARVQAGLVNVDLTLAVEELGLFYAPDPSSQHACTLGGNAAENSGGPHCFKHGSTTRHVLGLVIVRDDGSVLDLSRPAVDPVGYDLVGLFVGSEGMFGIATEITVKLTPTPAVTETLLAIFTDLDAACDSVSDAIAARLEPSALEILDKLTIEAVEASVFAAGYPKQAEAVLLIEVEGAEAEVEMTLAELSRIVKQRGAIDVRRARSAAERKKLWAGRKGAFGAMGRIAPDLYVADVVVPRTKLRELVAATTRIAREKRLKLANVFHAGDGNLHPNISYDRRDADEVARVLRAGEEIMRVVVAAGGSLSGEHGIGIEKQAAMSLVFGDDDLRAMCRVRDAWDPEHRMNPGKLIPVHVCREMRNAERPR
ncbi:MAG: FAD-binding protein [Planctomycetes bacterium]|nr:FAD-binding protein [Planctomycetota bacterium]